MVVGAVAVLVWAAALALPDGRLHVWFLDVGQGDGILIQTPAGRQVLVDGGSSGQVLLGQLGAVMPFWDRTLDLVVLTHPDADHMAAQVEAAGRYGIEAAWETPAAAADPASTAWRSAVEAAGAQVQVQSGGGWADLGDGVALWVLSPPAQGFGGRRCGQPELAGRQAGVRRFQRAADGGCWNGGRAGAGGAGGADRSHGAQGGASRQQVGDGRGVCGRPWGRRLR